MCYRLTQLHMVMMIIMRTFHRLTQEHCSKVGEDERLDHCYQQLQHEHEYRERHRYYYETTTYIHIQQCEDEYQADYAQYHNVTRKHVCKKTYHQCNWLDHQRHYLNKHQQALYQEWHIRRVQQVTPEIFVAVRHPV